MDEPGIQAWFAEYLEGFAACGRGDSDDVGRLLHFYGVPLVLTAGAGALVLTAEEDVLAAVRRQVDGMRAARYHRSEVLDGRTEVLNAVTALHRGAFVRRRGDGSEIGRLQATYLIVDGPAGRRICALAVHEG